MLPEEVTEFMSKSEEIVIMEVEKGAIRKFSDAVDDPNPLYWDDEYARSSRYGSIIAPPGFFGWPAKGRAKSHWFFAWPTKWENEGLRSYGLVEELTAALAKVGYTRNIDGGIDYEFSLPVRVGDTITATSSIKDIVERGKGDEKAIFLFIETTYTNQEDEVVATARVTTTHR